MVRKELWASIIASIAKPDDSKEVIKWKANNTKIISWILSYVEPHITLTLHPYTTAPDMWFHHHHKKKKEARIFQLDSKLENIINRARNSSKIVILDLLRFGLNIPPWYPLMFQILLLMLSKVFRLLYNDINIL